MPSRYTIKNRYRDKLRKIEEELGILNTCSNKIEEIIAKLTCSNKIEEKIAKLIENLDNNVGSSVTYTHHLEESQTIVRKLNIYRDKIMNKTAILLDKIAELFPIYKNLAYKRIAMKSASPSKTKKKEKQHHSA